MNLHPRAARFCRDEQGMGLLFGLLTAAVVAAIAWTMMTSGLVDMAISDNYRSHSAAFYAADAGIEQTLIDFKVDDGWVTALVELESMELVVPGPGTITINGHPVTLQLDGDGNVIPGYYGVGQPITIGDATFTREVWLPPTITFGDCDEIEAPEADDSEEESGSKASSKASSKAKSGSKSKSSSKAKSGSKSKSSSKSKSGSSSYDFALLDGVAGFMTRTNLAVAAWWAGGESGSKEKSSSKDSKSGGSKSKDSKSGGSKSKDPSQADSSSSDVFDPCAPEMADSSSTSSSDPSGSKSKSSSKASSKSKSKSGSKDKSSSKAKSGSKSKSKSSSKSKSDSSSDDFALLDGLARFMTRTNLAVAAWWAGGGTSGTAGSSGFGAPAKVAICHFAGATPKTLNLSSAAASNHLANHGSDHLGECTEAEQNSEEADGSSDSDSDDDSDLDGEEDLFNVPVYLTLGVRATGTSSNSAVTTLTADTIYEILPDGSVQQVAVRNWHRE